VGIADLVEVTPEMLATSLDERAARRARADLLSEQLRQRFGDDIIDFGIAASRRRADR
jgi:hypothetical protein